MLWIQLDQHSQARGRSIDNLGRSISDFNENGGSVKIIPVQSPVQSASTAGL